MRRVPLKHIVIIVAVLLVGGAGQAAVRQPYTELDLQVSRVWFQDDLLDNPTGFTASLVQTISRRSSLKFSYTRYRGDDLYSGYMASSLSFFDPDREQVWEYIEREYHANFFQIGFLREVSSSRHLKLLFGGGICILDVSKNLLGLTTRISRDVDYDDRVGLAMDITIAERLEKSGITIRLSFAHRFFLGGNDAQASDASSHAHRYLPESFITTEVRVGVGYRFYWGNRGRARENAEGGI